VTYGMGGPVEIPSETARSSTLIPVRAAHNTGGDTMIRFENANVIMIGDYYRNFGLPPTSTSVMGGSLKGMAGSARHHHEGSRGPDTRLVPGHGTIINRGGPRPLSRT